MLRFQRLLSDLASWCDAHSFHKRVHSDEMSSSLHDRDFVLLLFLLTAPLPLLPPLLSLCLIPCAMLGNWSERHADSSRWGRG
eukprot:761439-Hanusia_phi.AAC.7